MSSQSDFEQNLASLPDTSRYVRMELYADSVDPAVVIENSDGTRGTFRIYYAVSRKWGGIGPSAAKEALELYAEHVDDARSNPGKHPNIDRLFGVIENDEYFSVRCFQRD